MNPEPKQDDDQQQATAPDLLDGGTPETENIEEEGDPLGANFA